MLPSTRGVLISFEGTERVGKSTQINRLSQWLGSKGLDVLALREPGGTALGEALRRIVLEGQEITSPWAEFLIFAAARAELFSTIIGPALEEGKVVLVDRFIDSSVAYQAYGRQVPVSQVEAVNHWVTGQRDPDMTFLLVGAGWQERGGDIVEDRDQGFFYRVAQGYNDLAKRWPHRIYPIDAHQSVDQIEQLIQVKVATILGIA